MGSAPYSHSHTSSPPRPPLLSFIVTPLPLVLSLGVAFLQGTLGFQKLGNLVLQANSAEVIASGNASLTGFWKTIYSQSTTSVRMAESTKRQNNKAPVATPNVGQLVTLETAMNGAIGAK